MQIKHAGVAAVGRVGVSRLRRFLERRVEECYRRNVARIVPLLQRELGKAEGRLLATERELTVSNCATHVVYLSLRSRNSTALWLDIT
jgi:hypothetical protein